MYDVELDAESGDAGAVGAVVGRVDVNKRGYSRVAISFPGVAQGLSSIELMSRPCKIIISKIAYHPAIPPVMYSMFGWERSSGFGPVMKAALFDKIAVRKGPLSCWWRLSYQVPE